VGEEHDTPRRRPPTDQVRCIDHLDTRVTQRHYPHPHLSAYLVLAGVFATGMLGTTLPTPLYVLWQEHYRFPDVIITILFAAFTLGMLMALVFLGRVSDHFGRRPVLLGALGVACASTLLFVLAQQVLILLAGRFLSGLAAGLLAGTAPAGLAEFQPTGNLRQAGRLATATNLGSLGLGALVAGLFAQFAPAPTQLVFGVYLAILAMTVLLVVVLLPEPVPTPDRRLGLRPRLGVVRSTRAIFWPAALTALCLSAILGLFGALAPTLLRSILHVPNLTVAGGMVCVLFGAAAAPLLLLHGLTTRKARLVGVFLVLVGLALIEGGLAVPAFACFLVGTVIGGVGLGLASIGCLAAINQVSPPHHRAYTVSAYFAIASLSSLLVVGVGVLAQQASLFAASLVLIALSTLLLLLILARILWFDRYEQGGRS